MWPFPRIIAHRGGGTLAPENTIAGLRCGLEHGYRAVEFDVMLSADGIPVLMHDPAFGRTVPGIGNVSETSAALLAGMPITEPTDTIEMLVTATTRRPATRIGIASGSSTFTMRASGR